MNHKPQLTAESTTAEIAAIVSEALRDAGIDAVLSGGGAAAIYTDGAVLSKDLDFVTAAMRPDIDPVMEALGFRRSGAGRFYAHPDIEMTIEFPSGPLAIGGRHSPDTATLETPHGCLRILTSTTACQDRLIQWLSWGVSETLYAAAEIAAHNSLDHEDIYRFLSEEGATEDQIATWEEVLEGAKNS